MAKIYTRTGDQGTTGLVGGKRLGKTDPRLEALGGVDELGSGLGLVRALVGSLQKPDLVKAFHDLRLVQADLFSVNALLAGAEEIPGLAKRTVWLEREIDALARELVPQIGFIYPTGHPVAAQLFVARAVCRRTERSCLDYLDALPKQQRHALTASGIEPYLNRLSDYLFVLARWVNLKMGRQEEKWKPPQFLKPKSRN